MKQYAIVKNECEVKAWDKHNFIDRWEIENGVTYLSENNESELVVIYDTKEKAQEALQGYSSSISEYNSSAGGKGFYVVEEHYIQEIEIFPETENHYAYTERGEALDFAPFPDYTPEPEQEECIEP